MPDDAVTSVGFWDVFDIHANDTLALRSDLIINGQRFVAGVEVAPGQLLGGVDFNKRRGINLAIGTSPDGTHILRGFYLPPVS